MTDELEAESPAGEQRPPRGRGPVIAAVIALVALVGLLTGAGVGLSDIAGSIRDVFTDDPEPDVSAATAVAFDEAEGVRVEVWFGPATGGDGTCRFVRVVTAESGARDDDIVCESGVMLPWTADDFELRSTGQYFGFVHETPIGEPQATAVALSGAVHPAITAVRARFGDGAEYSFVPEPLTGWFAVILPDEIADVSSVDGSLVNPLLELALFDNDGRVLATADVPAWRLATGLR